MLKKSNFKANKIRLYSFLSISILILILFVYSLNIGKIFDSEKQQLQSFASSFSTPTQLFDKGDKPSFGHLTAEDIFPLSSNLAKSVVHGILGKENPNLKEIKIFIKFKNFEKILKDRENALLNNINVDSKNVPCKVSDGVNVYKCKVKLKGNRSDHWTSIKRMSLRISVKDGLIHGMQEFAIQKPGSRQFPYDTTFHNINNQLERLSAIRQEFFNITLNGESWGVMNAEPVIDEKFLELQEVKRLGIFRISDEERSAYFRRWNDGRYLKYFISDPSVTINIRGKESVILQNPLFKEIYSHVHFSISNQDGSIFNRKSMIGNLALALAWGDTHSLYPRNMWLTWNPYEQNLEPILTDQGYWRDVEKYINTMSDLPYAYKILFINNPLSEDELLNELESLDNYFKAINPIEIVNDLKKKNFPNDQEFETTSIFSNLSYLKENYSEIIQKINLISSQLNNEEVKQEKITIEQLKKIQKVSEIFYFDDGTIRIFNLLGDVIRVETIKTDDVEIEVNKVISPSKLQSLSFVDIKTDINESSSENISIEFNINGTKRIEKNTYSLNKINYELDLPKIADDICEYDELINQCILKGEINISESLLFTSKTTIEPGTKINLYGDGDLIFNSSVYMNGTKEEPIIIEGNGTGGIYIENTKDQISILENSNFYNLATMDSFLRRYTGSINGYGGTFIIKNINISNGEAEDQLNIINAKVNISELEISDAISDAFDCDFCEGTIQNISLENVGGDGLDISGSNLSISNMKAKDIKDKAFSVGEKSYAIIDNAHYESVATGIAVKDSSSVIASNIALENVLYDSFMTYIKKPFYLGNTKLEVKGYINDSGVESNLCVREKGTELNIDTIECNISEINVDELYRGRMKK